MRNRMTAEGTSTDLQHEVPSKQLYVLFIFPTLFLVSSITLLVFLLFLTVVCALLLFHHLPLPHLPHLDVPPRALHNWKAIPAPHLRVHLQPRRIRRPPPGRLRVHGLLPAERDVARAPVDDVDRLERLVLAAHGVAHACEREPAHGRASAHRDLPVHAPPPLRRAQRPADGRVLEGSGQAGVLVVCVVEVELACEERGEERRGFGRGGGGGRRLGRLGGESVAALGARARWFGVCLGRRLSFGRGLSIVGRRLCLRPALCLGRSLSLGRSLRLAGCFRFGRDGGQLRKGLHGSGL
ncbi:hypothetical protein BV25DRAFT_236725 [Artomyces pyxidatus]|uniref:Uncharacterized protein n=1 Tax=Artomyces pyxidatus TaxID=48021 RepID=A0ACB8SFN5_9AGAM|nr:hypothetical protein BV25DRAFT_236725 [Artomyces pyxidatus]